MLRRLLAQLKRFHGTWLLAFMLCAFTSAPHTNSFAQEVAVDVELVLAVDVSFSMDAREQRIQRDGYAAAFRHSDVIRAIVEGGWGKIAVSYVEWAGAANQSLVVPWTLIDSAEAAEAFALRLEQGFPGRLRFTSISGAIDVSARLFEDNGFAGLRKVIDVSGDGPNNMGRKVKHARDDAVARGIVINGLPLIIPGGRSTVLSIEDLDAYYFNCVIGGTGSFVLPVRSWEEFPESVRRKLVLELAKFQPAKPEVPVLKAGFSTPIVPVQLESKSSYDCLIGEKLLEKWLNFRQVD